MPGWKKELRISPSSNPGTEILVFHMKAPNPSSSRLKALTTPHPGEVLLGHCSKLGPCSWTTAYMGSTFRV